VEAATAARPTLERPKLERPKLEGPVLEGPVLGCRMRDLPVAGPLTSPFSSTSTPRPPQLPSARHVGVSARLRVGTSERNIRLGPATNVRLLTDPALAVITTAVTPVGH
jgi:hypothetical protein